MSDQRILPELITRPFQLLAAGLVFGVLVVGAFVGAATALSQPAWLPAAFAIAAFVVVVAVLGMLAFALFTPSRQNLLDNEQLERLMIRREAAIAAEARNLKGGLDAEGLSWPNVTLEGPHDLDSPELRETIARLELGLSEVSDADRGHTSASTRIEAEALVELARAQMASGAWESAADYLQRYLQISGSEDWQLFFSLGVACSNARAGAKSDITAIRAYSDALALRPLSAPNNDVGRVLSYRAGTLKRLERLAEAEADLHAARHFVEDDSFEADDVRYNLAAVYAMTGRVGQAFGELRQIRDARFLGAVLAHRSDYFKDLNDAPEFLALFGEA